MADFNIDRPTVEAKQAQFVIEVHGSFQGQKGDKGEPGQDGINGTNGQDGVSVVSIEQTTTSTESGGTNIVTATLSNGTMSTFQIKNGEDGSGGGNVDDVKYDDETVLDSDKVAQLYSEIYVGDTAPTKQQKIWFDTTEDDIALKDLDDDTTHRLVTDTEKTTWNSKQEALVSGTNIKTINNESILGSGNITIQGGGDTTDVKINGTSITSSGVADIKTYGTYNASSNKIATMNDLPSVPTKVSDLTNDSGYITGISSSDVTTALGYTPYNSTNPNGYTSNTGTITSVKMNGSTVSSSGEADLGTVITDISGKQDVIDSSHKLSADLISDGSTNKTVTSTEKTTWTGKQDALVSGTNIKTINNQSLLGSGNITISGGGGSVDDVNYDDVSVVDNDGVAQLYSEVFVGSLPPNKNQVIWIDTGAADVALRELQDDATHRLVTDNQMASWSGKQDALVSGTNIKTINSQSLLGSGDITISGGSSTDVQVNGTSIVSNDVANLVTATAYDATTNKLATESDLFSGDYDDLTDKPKINGITISGNKTAQMYGIQPAGNYATNPTITTNQINATYTFTLNNNTEYRNTLDMTSITLNLPATIATDYCSWLVFPSGSTATSMTYPNTIIWSGDDVSNNAFVPVADKTYNICFWYDSINVNAVVRGA